ncbi:MAG: glycosyltransferase family 4 protein [Myxococcota bacterium]
MHVVHVCRSGWPAIGGLESAVHGLAKALVGRGHRATVVTLDRDRNGQRLHPAFHEGVAYRRVRRRGPRRYPWARGLRQAVEDADLVHVHGIDGLADQLAHRSKGPPIGLSTHGGYFHTPFATVLKRGWWRCVTRRTLARLDAVWFTSKADATRFADVAGRIVPNGIEAARFRGPRRPDRDRWVVLGRVVPHKGVADLLDALRHQSDPVPHLELIGPVSEADRRTLHAASGPTRVHCWGTRSVAFVRSRLARAAWAVFPSRYEGFGLAALEAMAAGVPTIVANIPALREAVTEGVTGRIADFGKPGSAARVLDACRHSDGEALGRAGAAVAQRADWSQRVEGFLAAYQTVRRP